MPTDLCAEGLWQEIAKNLQHIPNTENYRLRVVLKSIFRPISEDTYKVSNSYNCYQDRLILMGRRGRAPSLNTSIYKKLFDCFLIHLHLL
jgi:hypothetical protein